MPNPRGLTREDAELMFAEGKTQGQVAKFHGVSGATAAKWWMGYRIKELENQVAVLQGRNPPHVLTPGISENAA